MKTPKVLLPALLQNRHDNGLCLDHDATVRIVNIMEKTLKAQARLLVAYRTGTHPPEWVFDVMNKARKVGLL